MRLIVSKDNVNKEDLSLIRLASSLLRLVLYALVSFFESSVNSLIYMINN